MLDVLVRNVDFVTRLSKAVGCWALGIGVIWRGYDVLSSMSGMYMLVLCILFGFSMVGLGVALFNEEAQQQ